MMNFRRTKPRNLAIILAIAISFCVYVVSWQSSDINRDENQPASETNTPTKLSPTQQKWNLVRYSDIGNWKLGNRSSSFEVPSVLLLSDDKRIYFHETAGHDHLNLRQLCAVESAAKKNPDRSVQIFFQTNHVNLTVDPLVSILRGYPNIAVILINVTDYFAGTVKCFLYVNAIVLIMSVLFCTAA